jgi:hypothetical protein
LGDGGAIFLNVYISKRWLPGPCGNIPQYETDEDSSVIIKICLHMKRAGKKLSKEKGE